MMHSLNKESFFIDSKSEVDDAMYAKENKPVVQADILSPLPNSYDQRSQAGDESSDSDDDHLQTEEENKIKVGKLYSNKIEDQSSQTDDLYIWYSSFPSKKIQISLFYQSINTELCKS